MGEGFQVTVFASDYKNKESSKDTAENEGVNELQKIIQEFPGKRTPHYSEIMGVPEKTLERWIKQLRDDQKIEFRGAPKTGGYIIKNKYADQ